MRSHLSEGRARRGPSAELPSCSTLSEESLTSNLSRRSHPPAASSDLEDIKSNWPTALHAAEEKKASDIRVLDLREVTSFTDFFLICSVGNQRQGQAVADEIHKQMKEVGELPVSFEGYDRAEWILMDYGDFLVHIFSESARSYYDLERLWRHARLVPAETLQTR
ncbi:MAG TPA: ribosome silencing factor [Bryobacteraceae bacterium]|nr:ribosome silencing factor [Bryobacteraceae bacterium]